MAASGVSVDAISQALYGGGGGSNAIYKKDEAHSKYRHSRTKTKLFLTSLIWTATEKTKDKAKNDGVTVDSISMALYIGWGGGGGSGAIYKKDEASSKAGN